MTTRLYRCAGTTYMSRTTAGTTTWSRMTYSWPHHHRVQMDTPPNGGQPVDESYRVKLLDAPRDVLRGVFSPDAALKLQYHNDHMSRVSAARWLSGNPEGVMRAIKFRKELAPLMATLRTAYREGWYSDTREALIEIQAHCERGSVAPPLRRLAVEATEAMASDESEDTYLVIHSCGHVGINDEGTTLHNRDTVCASCSDDVVEVDGDYYMRDDVYYWESDGEYHTSSEPDEDEDEDEDNDEPSSNRINSWGASTSGLNHDVTFTQTQHTDFTMGVELEVESTSRGFSDAIDECHYHFNPRYEYTRNYAMFKRDGSLSDQGFEIVTAARRLPDHIKAFSEWVPHDSLQAWNPGTCGLHVHIDSRAFSALTLGKFLMFINARSNKAFIKSLAGRHPDDGGSAQSYCAALDQDVITDPSKAVKSNNGSRYRMVNLCNLSYEEQRRLKTTNVDRDCKGDYSTVELRIFRASLKKDRLLAQIEFTHAAVIFCRTASWHSLTGDDFKDWIATSGRQYQHLSRWFGIRVPKTNTKATGNPLRVLDETTA